MPRPAGSALLVSGRGLVSGAIKMATRSEISHVAIADGEGGLVEALGGGVRVSPEAKYDREDAVWLTRMPLADPAAAVAEARRLVGKGYNYPAIGTFALETFGAEVEPLARWVDSLDLYICSEVALLAWRAGGLDPWPGAIPCTVAPAQFAEAGLRHRWAA